MSKKIRATICFMTMFFALVDPSTAFAEDSGSSLSERKWTVDGVTRTALMHIPNGSERTNTPVVFVFHGRGGNSEAISKKMAIHTFWPEAIVVYPQGLPSAIRYAATGVKPGWQQGIGDKNDRDLMFFDEILRTLRAEFEIDESRVFVTGHSMGGAFSYLLWCARGDVIAAVASSAGTPRNFDRCKPKPAMHIAGERDEIIPYVRQQRTMEAVRRLNGCDDTGQPWAEGGQLAGTLFPSQGGYPFVSLIHPGGHNYPAEASPLIVKFFKEQSNGADPSQDSINPEELISLPQPDQIFSWVEEFASKEHRRPGTPEYHWAVDYFVEKLEDFGFEDVKKEPIDMMVWQADDWSLTIDHQGEPVEISSFWEWHTGFTQPEGVKAPMIYVGLKLEPEHDVNGRIVVAEGRFTGPVRRRNHASYPKDHPLSKRDIYWQAVDRGAVGVVFITSVDSWPGYNYKRFLPPVFDASERSVPVLVVPISEGAPMRRYAEQQLEAILVLSGTRKPGVVYNVHAVLPGQSEENIIVSSHLDSGFKGAIEDASGVSSVLAQAYTWSKVPIEYRPKTLVFVGTGSHYYPRPLGATRFALDHKDDLMKNNLLVINVEHFASRQYRADGLYLVPTGHMQPMRIHHNGKSGVTWKCQQEFTVPR